MDHLSLLTALSWGVYGVILHKGRGLMPDASLPGPPSLEAQLAGLKAFLLVCVAYAVIGVAAGIMLKVRGSNWTFTGSGITWSFIAGMAGAIGAFTLILALGAAAAIFKGAAPAAVMPLVFGGAPVVNSLVALSLHPPQGGFKAIPVPFVVGVILATCGAVMVAKYAPSSAPVGKPGAAPAKH
jgi:hypothetical protein